MTKAFRSMAVSIFVVLAVGSALTACSKTGARNETVASVNGDEIKAMELREFMGVRGGMTPVPLVPLEKKKEALQRLVAGRLLAQDARGKGLDNTAEFKEAVRQNERGVLIAALYRKELESKARADDKETQAETKKLREADKNLSEADAALRAAQAISERQARQVEEDLIAAAKKDLTPSVNKELLQKIAKGEKVEDQDVLASVGAEKISYGEVKRQLAALTAGQHAGDLSRNPMAIEKMLDREVTGHVLAAYARKQGIEGSEWMKAARSEMERSVLINLVAEKIVANEGTVSDKEIGDAYAEHAQMFVRNGKKVPLAEVKEQIRAFLLNAKRRKVLEAYIEGLKKSAKITVNEEPLGKS